MARIIAVRYTTELGVGEGKVCFGYPPKSLHSRRAIRLEFHMALLPLDAVEHPRKLRRPPIGPATNPGAVSFTRLFDRAHLPHRSFRNSSGVSPASCAMAPMVNALTGLWRGIVRMRWPSDMTTCLPSRTTLNPALSSARTA